MSWPAHRPAPRRRATGQPAHALAVALVALLVLLLGANPAPARAESTAPSPTAPLPSAPLPSAPLPSGPSPAAAGAAATAPIQIDLVAVSPPAPVPTALEQPVSISAVLTNVSDTTYSAVRVVLDRGAPIVQRVLLHEALADPPSTNLYTAAGEPLRLPGPLAPGASASVTFVTTPEAMGLFNNGVYPYDLVAEGTIGPGPGPFREVGRASLLVPSLYTPPTTPLSISWLWPLIDVPHLLPEDLLATGSGARFANDELADSIDSGGRLDRALQVVEAVTPAVRMTLVIDPQLINELLLMGEGYTVARGGAAPVDGAGSEEARLWLDRLKAVAGKHDVVLTGLADPDLDSVAAGGLPRTGPLSAAMAQRISSALGATYRTDPVWPIDETLSQVAADMVLSAGAGSILLRDSALSGGTRPDTSSSSGGTSGEVRGLSDTALTPLSISGSTSSAGAGVVLDSSLRRRVIEATESSEVRGVADAPLSAEGATAATRVQALVSELAMWPLAGAAGGGYVALAPDRAVDPDATAAASAILATATTGWTTITPVREAVQTAARIPRGALADSTPAAGLDSSIVTAVREADGRLRAAADLLGPTASSSLATARAALLVATSSAWRDDPGPGLAYARAAGGAAQGVVTGVSVVTPDNASYSLSSENSPLIITVRNDLEFAVSIRLHVTPATASASGFRADDIGVQVIEAGTARTLQIPAHFERSGRFEVVAQLATESGAPLGDPVRLSVLCTAYGTVALTITVAAFSLLLLLLLFRAVRGVRRAHRARSAAGA